MQQWRLVDDLDRRFGAPEQMDRDVALLASVATGAPPILRVYQWHVPALSLGHFQSADDVDSDACRGLGVEVVRRPTGGRALLHGGDLTYAVAMPRPEGAAGRVDGVYDMVASGLIAGLARLGLRADVARNDGPAGPVCFAGQQGADLRVGERKVCGSAQVRRGGVVLQHGSIRLRRLAFDETDLLRLSPTASTEAKSRLRAGAVTLDELGARSDAHEVAAAVVAGFASTLDLEFMSQLDVEVGALGDVPSDLDLRSRSSLAPG